MSFVVGDLAAVGARVERLRAEGVEATPVALSGGEAGDSAVAALAGALVELEALFRERQPRQVLLADASDAALAAALVAAKLLIPVTAAAAAREDRSANGRLIAQLTG